MFKSNKEKPKEFRVPLLNSIKNLNWFSFESHYVSHYEAISRVKIQPMTYKKKYLQVVHLYKKYIYLRNT